MIRIATKALYDEISMVTAIRRINGDDTIAAAEVNERNWISVRAEHVLDSNMYEFTLKSSASVYNLASKIFHKQNKRMLSN